MRVEIVSIAIPPEYTWKTPAWSGAREAGQERRKQPAAVGSPFGRDVVLGCSLGMRQRSAGPIYRSLTQLAARLWPTMVFEKVSVGASTVGGLAAVRLSHGRAPAKKSKFAVRFDC